LGKTKSLRESHFNSGDVIFKEGETGQQLYIIQSGQVEISRRAGSEKVVLAILGSGDIFGEMALMGSPSRTATATAVKTTTCLTITRMMFREKLKSVPAWMRKFYAVALERLRETNRRIDPGNYRPIGHQMVELLSVLMPAGQRDNSGQPYLPWDNLVHRMSYILSIPEKQITMGLEMLANTDLAGYEIELGHGRRFLVKSLDNFQRFAKFLRLRLQAEKRNRPLPEAEAISKEDHGLLGKLLEQFATREGIQNKPTDKLLDALAKAHNLTPEETETSYKQLIRQGIIKEQRNEKKALFSYVNMAKAQAYMATLGQDELFVRIEEKIKSFSLKALSDR